MAVISRMPNSPWRKHSPRGTKMEASTTWRKKKRMNGLSTPPVKWQTPVRASQSRAIWAWMLTVGGSRLRVRRKKAL